MGASLPDHMQAVAPLRQPRRDCLAGGLPGQSRGRFCNGSQSEYRRRFRGV